MYKFIAVALLVVSSSAFADSLSGRWLAQDGAPGEMEFKAGKLVELRPVGAQPLIGKYVLSGKFLEIRPNSSRSAATLYVQTLTKDKLVFRDDTGSTQSFKKLK